MIRWFRANVGTITSEESVRVVADGIERGTLEGAYAERLQPGDRFVLDGRALEFQRLDGLTVHARFAADDPDLPRWTSDRQGLSAELADALARFRERAAALVLDGPEALRAWLCAEYELDARSAGVLVELFESQHAVSDVPDAGAVLVEESPHPDGFAYAFHVPLNRAVCEALGRATAARLGRRFGRDLGLTVADLGWSIRLPEDARIGPEDVAGLLAVEDFEADVLKGLDRGELLARRFRHVAATGLMVLRNPEGGRQKRVGGLLWVSQRLYPLVQAAAPDHPLLRETRREVLEDLLDTRGALAWLGRRPAIRFRRLEAPSPFTVAWIDPAGAEPLHFEPPAAALRRLHGRLMGVGDEV